MSVSEELLEILVCPETKQPVKPASAEQIEAINGQVSAGTLRTRGGEPVAKPTVDDGIPVMLIEESIEL